MPNPDFLLGYYRQKKVNYVKIALQILIIINDMTLKDYVHALFPEADNYTRKEALKYLESNGILDAKLPASLRNYYRSFT